jgi:antitoxin VapB
MRCAASPATDAESELELKASSGRAYIQYQKHPYGEPIVALSIRDAEADRLARELAALTGETMTGAIRVALEQRLERERRRRDAERDRRRRAIDAIVEHCASLPVLDDRSDDEILGYNEHGLPS